MENPQIELARKIIETTDTSLFLTGKAGTGKTTLLNMISTMLTGRRKLFLTKTHTALQNLRRRIEDPGVDAYHLPPLCLAPPIQKNSAHTA